jgi:hypothetical protein
MPLCTDCRDKYSEGSDDEDTDPKHLHAWYWNDCHRVNTNCYNCNKRLPGRVTHVSLQATRV